MKSNYDEKTKETIIAKDKCNFEFKKRLANIKQKYGIEFEVNLLNNNNIDCIKFYNLVYKKLAHDLSMIYYNQTNYYGAIIYTVNKNASMNKETYLSKKNYFGKQYKIESVIDEIKQANEKYREMLQSLNPNSLNNEKVLEKTFKKIAK